MRKILFLISIAFPLLGFSQQTFQFEQQFQVVTENGLLSMPFAGGINAAQIQHMDVDGDGLEELIVWDINSRRLTVFKNSSEETTVLTEMTYFFPTDVSGFLVLADFDGDGKKDLFTSTPFGIKAYRNITPAGNPFPQWDVAQNFLRLDNGSNLQTNNLDVPLIMDLDGDGDLDIVTFNFASGDYLQFYLNTSIERKGKADIDGFAFPVNRWGEFEFCGCGTFSFGVTCAGFPIGRKNEELKNSRIQHSGGHSMLYHDFTGDGIRDLLMGQDECSSLYFLPNKGSNELPIFDEFSTSLPEIGQLPEFPIFHAASLFQNQLLISSNSSALAGVFQANYARNIYQIDLSDEMLKTDAFLQKDMVDLGENSRPFFRGNGSSGELIVTSNSLQDGGILGVANRFSVGKESWNLIENNDQNFSDLELTDLQYQEYINVRGDIYYWIAGVDTFNFSLRKQIRYSKSADFSSSEILSIPNTVGLQPLDHFEFFIYQNQEYMLLAKQTGELLLYDVRFSNGINLTLNQSEFLGFADNPASRNLTVHVIPGPKPSLYAVDQRGILIQIRDFMNQAERENVGIRLLEDLSVDSRLGRNSWISHIPDPFGENIQLILGNRAGGIQLLKREGINQEPSDLEFLTKVYPNPGTGIIKIISSQSATGRLMSSMGQVLVENISVPANTEVVLQAQMLPPGLYFLQLINDKGENVSKKIIVKN